MNHSRVTATEAVDEDGFGVAWVDDDRFAIIYDSDAAMHVTDIRVDIAKLALRGYFTWDDVDALREAEVHANDERVSAVADRIAALLPPREAA
jgi:hypothetical protein